MARRLPLLGLHGRVHLPDERRPAGAERLRRRGAVPDRHVRRRDGPRQWPALAVFGAVGIVLGAWYLLTMLQRVFFGPLKEPHVVHDTASRMRPTTISSRPEPARVAGPGADRRAVPGDRRLPAAGARHDAAGPGGRRAHCRAERRKPWLSRRSSLTPALARRQRGEQRRE